MGTGKFWDFSYNTVIVALDQNSIFVVVKLVTINSLCIMAGITEIIWFIGAASELPKRPMVTNHEVLKGYLSTTCNLPAIKSSREKFVSQRLL